MTDLSREQMAERIEELERDNAQLRYERRLLGACRRHLDEIADPEGRYTVETIRTASDLAQRIVDEIGHSVTDEPALGPDFRERIAELEERIAKVREMARAALMPCEYDKTKVCTHGENALDPDAVLAVLDEEGEDDFVKPALETVNPADLDSIEAVGKVLPLLESVHARLDEEQHEPEFIEFTREGWEKAAKARLGELGCTYAELAQMARDGVFESHQHHALWVLIGGTLDGEGEGKR